MLPYNTISCTPLTSRVHATLLSESLRTLPYGDPVGCAQHSELGDDGLDFRDWICGCSIDSSANNSRGLVDIVDLWPEIQSM